MKKGPLLRVTIRERTPGMRQVFQYKFERELTLSYVIFLHDHVRITFCHQSKDIFHFVVSALFLRQCIDRDKLIFCFICSD